MDTIYTPDKIKISDQTIDFISKNIGKDFAEFIRKQTKTVTEMPYMETPEEKAQKLTALPAPPPIPEEPQEEPQPTPVDPESPTGYDGEDTYSPQPMYYEMPRAEYDENENEEEE